MSVDLSTTDLSHTDEALMDPGWYDTPACHEAMRVLRNEDPVRWVSAANYEHGYWLRDTSINGLSALQTSSGRIRPPSAYGMEGARP